MADNWVRPTSFNDPDSKWDNEALAYDNDIETEASESQDLEKYLELILSSSITCDKVRVYAHSIEGIPDIDARISIDVYYSSAWYNIFSGTLTKNAWIEKTIGSTQTVTKARVKGLTGYILYIGEFNFNQLILATVTTQAVTDILSTTATGNGNITAIGSANPTKRGVCYNTTGNPTVADDVFEEEGSFGTGAFTASMTGLDPGVKYYVKAYAYNLAGYAYGSQVDFTTDKAVPTVTTQDPTDVLTTSATGNGNITALGGENATVRGFKYGLTQTNTWDAHDDGDYGVGAYTKGLTGLLPNTEYWIRAYATNSIGTSYGAWVKFQTAAAGTTPTGTKISICSDYSGYTYILNESLTDDGSSYESYFTLSTDLAEKQGLHIKKRLLDLFSYFESKDTGTCKIYIKQDNEADWQYCGEVSMVGDEDIVVPHLPSENQDSSGDVDFLAKTYLIKYVFDCDFDFIGLITEFVPIGVR